MSICNQQQMDMLKVLYYVAWSLESMPHVSNRYCQYQESDFAQIPFEMFHGVENDLGTRVNRRRGKLTKYEWHKDDLASLIYK